MNKNKFSYDSENVFFNQSPEQERGVKINGLQQVVEMLTHADPAFRASLLKRLTAKDPKLAQSLRNIIR